MEAEWALAILMKVVCEESLVGRQISEGQGTSQERA